MKYFWIIGENEELVHNALSYLHATNIIVIKKNIISFETEFHHRLQTCASLIKWGIVLDHQTLEKKIISDTVGVADNKFWVHLKKQFNLLKRFKLVELIHTDLEIKNEWQEVVSLGENIYGLVQWYQNISLYETIDFNKPVGWMGIGMMPSKLALTLINIWVGEYEDLSSSTVQNWQLTIRDPFCGFGTTNFLANHLWYNTIWSDINTTQAKQNRKRRINKTLSQETVKSFFLKQDVTKELKSPIFRHATIIVSEWRLGNTVTSRTAPATMHMYASQVQTVYTVFAKNLTEYQKDKKPVTLIMTIPVWLKYEISISQTILEQFASLWRTARLIEQPYSREKQLVGRQILIANFL